MLPRDEGQDGGPGRLGAVDEVGVEIIAQREDLRFIAGLLCGFDGMVERPVSPPDLLGASRHMWDEATYETVAWCGPALGSEVLR